MAIDYEAMDMSTAHRGRGPEITTIGKLARRFGLSRSTLLYYDSIDLLKPKARSNKGYRLYSPSEVERLRNVCRYRAAGIALADIKQLLDSPGSRLADVLEIRLESLNSEIQALQDQQRLIVGLMENQGQLSRVRIMSRDRWTSLIAASGFTESEMLQWHTSFERAAPSEHQEFLELLCFSDREIRDIRAYAAG